MITFKHKGNFKYTEKFFNKTVTSKYLNMLDQYGREGVAALSASTPIDSGETAKSWNYEIKRFRGGAKISWSNSHVIDGVPIAILIQYGHGTKNGGYVQGRDFINPTLRPIFDRIAEEAWKGVTT
jgi:hypothetical protein